MTSASSHDRPVSPASTAAASEVGPDLLPGPYESASEYLERLRAHHERVGALIEAIEERRPGAAPGRRERADGERRDLDDERRTGVAERREGGADAWAVWPERRSGPRERRIWRVLRREGLERRRDPSPVPWRGKLHADRVTIIWAVQIAVWLAVALLALIFGVG